MRPGLPFTRQSPGRRELVYVCILREQSCLHSTQYHLGYVLLSYGHDRRFEADLYILEHSPMQSSNHAGRQYAVVLKTLLLLGDAGIAQAVTAKSATIIPVFLSYSQVSFVTIFL